MFALVFAAQLLTAAPSSAPAVAAGTGQTRTLADVARERKLGIKPKTLAAFSAAQSTVAPATGKMTDQEKWELEQGEPLRRNVTFTGHGGTSEQLVYPNGIYVHFRNGKFVGGQVPVK